MIQLQQVSLQRGTQILLDDVDLTVFPQQKWGVIGGNGSGKSSLFKMLLGQLHNDTGTLAIPSAWTIAHMAQEVGHSDKTALEYILDGDRELRIVQQKIAENPSGEELANCFAKMETIDGYTADSRAQKLLFGLGFKPADAQRPVSAFSGGWRIRLNLAQALMCRSDLLLLDEPTNHLDLDATLWLEQWLKSYVGTLLIISHDRDFLDNVVAHVVNFENAKLVSYNGNYSAYEKQKAERLAQQASAFAKQQERVAQIEDFVRRFRAKASKAKQAQSRLKELEKMETISPAHVDSPFTFKFPTPEKLPQQLINFQLAQIGYANKTILQNVNLSVLGQTRVGLLGHNGAGKSTLVKALIGELPLLAGERNTSMHLKLGYFAQHQLEALDLDASCALHLQRITPKATEQAIRNFLGSFGFQGDRAFETIRHFSGGEKARLAIAIVAWQKPNVLILDEPTNHLDLEVRHALTLALQAYEGAIVVISHDRHLLRNTVDEFWLVADGEVQEFDGDLADYYKWSQESQRSSQASNTHGVESSEKPTKTIGDKKEQRQAAAAAREQLKPYTKEIKSIERKLETLQAEVAKLDTQLADPTAYENPTDDLQALIQKHGRCKQELDELEELWLVRTDELEELKRKLDLS